MGIRRVIEQVNANALAACAPCKGAKFSGWKSHLVKVSTAPPIASLESVMVTVLTKRRQQGDRVGRR